MERDELSTIRRYLEKTESQMGLLLGVSPTVAVLSSPG
jgi:hypothetical protein